MVRGVQYASADDDARLADAGTRVSMAAVGNPYENALAERFCKTLKREEVYRKDGLTNGDFAPGGKALAFAKIAAGTPPPAPTPSKSLCSRPLQHLSATTVARRSPRPARLRQRVVDVPHLAIPTRGRTPVGAFEKTPTHLSPQQARLTGNALSEWNLLMARGDRVAKTATKASARDHLDDSAKSQRVYAILEETYGAKHNHPDGDPLDGLISTILSQATSDVNSSRAHRALRAAFPDWEEVIDAPAEIVADAIRSGGLANLKARRIKETLAAIKERRGDLDLAFLDAMPQEEALAWLRALPGVGPKTAACVLLFDLGRPALPVDTHVHRVSRRLGLIGPKVSAERAHGELQAQLDPAQVYEFHLNMIAHGRRTCHAQRPRCEACPLTRLCNYYKGESGSAER